METALPILVETSGDELQVTVGGNILSTNVSDTREHVLRAISDADERIPGWRTLHLDLTAAQMIDSTGLNFLVAVSRHMRQRSLNLRISVSSSNIQRSFSFIRLDRQAQIILKASQSNA